MKNHRRNWLNLTHNLAPSLPGFICLLVGATYNAAFAETLDHQNSLPGTTFEQPRGADGTFLKLLSSIMSAKSESAAKTIVAKAVTQISDGSLPEQTEWNLLKSMQKEHPRIMVTAMDMRTVCDTIKTDQIAAHLHDVLTKRAEQMLQSPGPHYSTKPEGALTEARLALKRITTFAALYRIDHNERYLEQARADMLAVAAFPDWGPANFLDVAETTAAMGIGYDWLFEQLNEKERKIIRDAIVDKGLDPGLKQYHGDGWWRIGNSNWNFVCNGGLSVGALAIAESEPVRASKIIACAVLSTPLGLKSLEPDGGWAEGPMYWDYGTRYLTYFLSSLHSALNQDFGFSKSPGLSETGMYRIYTESPNGTCFNYADSETEVGRAAQMFWLSREFKQPVYGGAELHVAEMFPEMFHLLFYRPEHVTPAAAALPLNKLFKGVNVVCLRSSWTDPSAAFVGFKGGDNRAHHADLDLGTFIFDVDGLRWAEDLGPDNYDLPGYFAKQRWDYYRTRTEGQNTLTIESNNQNLNAKAKILEFSSSSKTPYAIADLSEAYKDRLLSVKRGIKLDQKNGVIVEDEISAPAATPLEWHMHTLAKVELSADGRTAVLTRKNGERIESVRAEILLPDNASFHSKSVALAPPQYPTKGITDLTIPLKLESGETTIVVHIGKSTAQQSVIQKLSEWR